MMEAVADVFRHKHGLPTKYNHEGLPQITVRAGHGPGKTHACAKVMHWFNFIQKARIPCTGPKERSLTTRLWPEFRKILGKSIPEYREAVKVDNTKITWEKDPDWCALVEAAASTENIAGYHDDFMLFVVEEASGVDEKLFPAIEGALSTGIIVISLYIGNPTRNTGTFHDSHRKVGVKEDFYRIHASVDKAPRVSRKWIERMERRYGKDSPVVKVRCYGEFADMDENQLLPLDWIIQAAERERGDDGSFPRLRVVVDVADGGEAKTAIGVFKQYASYKVLLRLRQFSFPQNRSSILAAKAAKAVYQDYGGKSENGDDIVVDALGVGAGTAGWLIDEGMPVVAYRGGESSDDVKQWKNRRTQSYIVLRNDLRDEILDIAEGAVDRDDWDDFLAQLCSIKTVPGTERVEEIEPKLKMIARGEVSPDMADVCAMSNATQVPTLGSGSINIEDEVYIGPDMMSARG